MLLGARIKNYILLSDLKVGIEAADLKKKSSNPSYPISNLTAFIGRNGTGKSLFLDSLSFFSDSILHGCSFAATQRGRSGFSDLLHNKTEPMEFSFLFLEKIRLDRSEEQKREHHISYSVHMQSDDHGRPYISKECIRVAPVDSTLADEKISFKDVLIFENGVGHLFFQGKMIEAGVADRRSAGLAAYGLLMHYPALTTLYNEIIRWFFCDFTDFGNKTVVAPGGHRHLNSRGSNAKNVLEFLKKEHPERYAHVVDKISQKIPNVRHKGNLPDIFRKSPNKLFLYLLLLEDLSPRPVICMETPDEGLYHDMVDVLAEEFRDYTLRHPMRQIFFTSHNPYILESLTPQEVWIFSKDRVEQKISVHCAAENQEVLEMYKQGVGMGAIWYAGHFDEE